MYFYGFLHSIQLFLVQGADKFYHPAFVEGSNLIGLDFGIFGQIRRTPHEKHLKRIRGVEVLRGNRQNGNRPGEFIALVVGNDRNVEK